MVRTRRLPVVIVVAVVLAVGIVAGRHGRASEGSNAAPTVATVSRAAGPQVAPADALSSSWFCAGATDTPKSPAPGTLLITNVGRRSVTADIDLVASHGRSKTEKVTVAPDHRAGVAETVPHGTPWVGATVDINGGAATVEQRLEGPLGTVSQPCVTAGSTSWYFPTGATLVNERDVITLLNPYPDAAIASLTFTTNEGVEQPSAFQTLVVPAHGLIAVDLRSHLRRRTHIATSVTAQTGRVVAWQTTVTGPPPKRTPYLGTKAARRPNADPASPVFGVTESPGASSTSTSWYWPQGSTAAGLGEQYTIYNPGTHTAQVSLAMALQQGTAEPFTISVGPEEVVPITAAGQARIPSGSVYGVSLTSTNGVGVVAARRVAAQAPASVRGAGVTTGATAPATKWLVGGGDVTRTLDQQITVSDPTATPATVTASLVAGGKRTPLRSLTAKVPNGGSVSWDLGALHPAPSGAILVTASSPVVVASQLSGRHGRTGVGLALGVPFAG